MEINNYDEWEVFEDMETVVSAYIEDTDRWHQYWVMVVKDKEGKFWELSWRDGATEYQELDFEDRGYCAIEVVPYETTVTKYKSV